VIDFPASPTLNQSFTAGAASWRWDGTKWIAQGTAVLAVAGTSGDLQTNNGSGNLGAVSPATYAAVAQAKSETLVIAVSDETSNLTTGAAKVTFRMPWAMTLSAVRASLSTASTSGNPAIDVNEGGVSIFSTGLTIDANEKTSTTAATAAVISDLNLADDAEITIDIDAAGTNAKGLKVAFIGTRA